VIETIGTLVVVAFAASAARETPAVAGGFAIPEERFGNTVTAQFRDAGGTVTSLAASGLDVVVLSDVEQIPEPSSLRLLVVGSLGILAFLRQRRRIIAADSRAARRGVSCLPIS
jgi:hypothetical protein